jgi:hypothetical protein
MVVSLPPMMRPQQFKLKEIDSFFDPMAHRF